MEENTSPKELSSDALQHPPSFEQMVELIKKLFTDYLTDIQKGVFTPDEIEKSWERYKTLNHLYQDATHMNKHQFDELHKWLKEESYSFDGEYYYDDENNFFTPDQIWDKYKQQKGKLL